MLDIYHGHGNIVQFHWVWSWWNISPMRIFFSFFLRLILPSDSPCAIFLQSLNSKYKKLKKISKRREKKLTKINLWTHMWGIFLFFFFRSFCSNNIFFVYRFSCTIVDSVDSRAQVSSRINWSFVFYIMLWNKPVYSPSSLFFQYTKFCWYFTLLVHLKVNNPAMFLSITKTERSWVFCLCW